MNPTPPQDAWTLWVERWMGQFVLALVLTILFFGVRLGLDPLLGDRQAYAPAYGAVALAAWLAGWRCGVLTIIACAWWGTFFFVEPRGTLELGATEVVGVITFAFTSLVIVILGNAARRANLALREADFAKDHFIATLSHELRNPLAPIVNGIQILRQKRMPDDEAAATVGMLERQARHLTRLMDDLLDISRITRGRVELHREPIDLAGCIAQAVEIALPRGGADRTIEVRVAEGLPTILADATRITQIVGNLLNNAVKFAPPGTPIVVEARREGDEVLVSVRDQGPGIDVTLLPGLFSPYSPPSDPSKGGLGIGLWLANRLAQLHGGRIDVVRPASGGVEMVVRLPSRT